MPARRPDEVHALFADAFNRADLDALLALYTPDAVLVTGPDSSARGHAAIREALAGYLALNGTIVMRTAGVYETGDLALLHCDWTISATGPDGNPAEVRGRSSEVVRRQPDGNWLYVLDNPSTGP